MSKKNGMIGAIVGDIAGSRFEWHNRKSKRFTFLKGTEEGRYSCSFTDDTVMTLAVADAIAKWRAGGRCVLRGVVEGGDRKHAGVWPPVPPCRVRRFVPAMAEG